MKPFMWIGFLVLSAFCMNANAFVSKQSLTGPSSPVKTVTTAAGRKRVWTHPPLFQWDDKEEQRYRLRQFGYSEEETNQILKEERPQDDLKVNVNEMNVDPFTLTGITFVLLALNFLVFANMGDGGIAGIAARIINSWDN